MKTTKEIWYLEENDAFTSNGYFDRFPLGHILNVWEVCFSWYRLTEDVEVLSKIRVLKIGHVFFSQDRGWIDPAGDLLLNLDGEQAEVWYGWLLQNGIKDLESFNSEKPYRDRQVVKEWLARYEFGPSEPDQKLSATARLKKLLGFTR